MSTAYHSQTDGQMEIINQVIESYLQSYCNNEPNVWAWMLAMAKYGYNNSNHSAAKISPFYPNYGFKPRTNWPTDVEFSYPASEHCGYYMTSVHLKLSEQLEQSIEDMWKYNDKKPMSIEPLNNGELVILNHKNMRAIHCCKTLEDKMYGPFEVIAPRKNGRYCTVKLAKAWKIYPTFNISLLEQYRGTNLKKQVDEIDADNAGWKMGSLIANGYSDDDPMTQICLVKWEEYSHDENTWEMYENAVEDWLDLLKEYYG